MNAIEHAFVDMVKNTSCGNDDCFKCFFFDSNFCKCEINLLFKRLCRKELEEASHVD